LKENISIHEWSGPDDEIFDT